MPLTRSFKDTVKARAERDPVFRDALLTEAIEHPRQHDCNGEKSGMITRSTRDPAAHQALIREQLARDMFTLPDIPDWKLERQAVTAYKQQLVRHLRAIAAVHGYTHGQLAWRLRVSPRRTRRLLDGHVVLDDTRKLHRLVLRLDPQADVPTPDTIPAMTEAEREEALAGIRKKLDASLANPRPSTPAAEVFARLKDKFRALRPMDHLPVEGRLTCGRHTSVYARDPGTNLYHGEIENLRDLVTFQAPTLPELETAFTNAVVDYEAFCSRPAA